MSRTIPPLGLFVQIETRTVKSIQDLGLYHRKWLLHRWRKPKDPFSTMPNQICEIQPQRLTDTDKLFGGVSSETVYPRSQ
jgi:hypothetical protein